MGLNRNKLARQQLDETLRRYRILLESPSPRKGWIRSIRDALGMSGRQLAGRVRLSQQRVAVIEKQELDGSLTLKTLRKMAEGLDCALVFSLVPRKSLEQTFHEQVERIVQDRLARAGHLMDLEGQGLAEEDRRRIREEMVAELLAHPPSTLWREG